MEELVDVVNKLQNIFTISGCKKIDLPQVVVVGNQSSGKSSVLEHLVGRSFLPRGPGLVTRCPLIIQLSKVNGEEHAVFQHGVRTKYTDYSLITKQIENETERLAGANKGICNSPIIITLCSPHFTDLTLVDLPGLTKVPVGDQPTDIEDQTRDLIMEYVSNPNSIILTVIPANVDMATSEALKIAREVDKSGDRTLAVVTKLDLMDEGTDALDILNGMVIPVKLGIIGVVNRSQKNVIERQSIEESLNDEKDFFQKYYSSIAYRHGTPYLTKCVQQILINHIYNCLPKLRDDIHYQLATSRERLVALGESNFEHFTTLLNILLKLNGKFLAEMKGNVPNIDATELQGGARISNTFKTSFVKSIDAITVLKGISKEHILIMMQNASGVSPALVPETTFEMLVKHEIEKLREPCLQFVESIHNELIIIGQSLMSDPDVGLGRFPKLQWEVSNLSSNFLRKRVPPTKEMINYFIDVHRNYINKEDPDLAYKMSEVITRANNLQQFLVTPKSKAENDYDVVMTLTDNYFSLIKKTVKDTVFKIIMFSMVDYTTANLHPELIEKLYPEAAEILSESSEVRTNRERLNKDISALESANEVLNTVSKSIFQ